MDKQQDLLKKKINKLGAANTARISVWLATNAPRIKDMFCNEIGKLAQKELAIEMPITDQSIRPLCRTLNITFRERPRLDGTNGKKSNGLQRVAALEQQVAALTERLTNLEISLGGVRN